MRSQKIKYDAQGREYVTSNGKKILLEQFIRVGGPWGSGEDTITINGKAHEVHGWHSVGYFGAYAIQLSACGEAAKVFYKQNF